MLTVVNDPIEEIIAGLSQSAAQRCRIEPMGQWWHIVPHGMAQRPGQGWKLHLSVLPAQAPELLATVSDLLIERGVEWKVARSIAHLRALLSVPTPLPQVGKFITVYPATTAQALELAALLHERTAHFDGPSIPSDRRYAPNSRLFYRYGGFTERYFYDRETALRWQCIAGPDGALVKDTRAIGAHCPPWEHDPFPALPPLPAPRPQDGLFGKGLRVRGLLSQSLKGGVYIVERGGATMVLKEGRLATNPDGHSRDTRDRIANEHRVLRLLEPLEIAPRPIELFEADQNTYLLMEHLPGQSLRAYIDQCNYMGVCDVSGLRAIAASIRSIVERCHAAGVVLRDLTPNNLLVTSHGCTLVDLELAHIAGSAEPPFHGFTHGYAPEAHHLGERAEPSYDNYALGAVIFYIITGLHPFLSDRVHADTNGAAILAAFLRDPQLADLAEEARRLMHPAALPPPAEPAPRPRSAIAPSARPTDVLPYSAADLLPNALALADELCATARWDAPAQLWEQHATGKTFFPASFHGGTTGIAFYLTEIALVSGRRKYDDAARRIVDWTQERYPFVPGETPAGLFFGYAGLPWLLGRLAERQDDAQAQARAVDLALQIADTPHGRLDITHGAAGIGLMLLDLHRRSGDPRLLERALAIAHTVASRAEPDAAGQIAWGQGEQRLWGMAHGAAGMAYFLLAADAGAGANIFAPLVASVGETLLAHAVPTVNGQGRSWRRDAASTKSPWTHWCSGAAGVGEFLLAAGTALSNPAFTRAAEQAANAIALGHSFGSCNQCHGLAGDGELLLRVRQDLPHAQVQPGIARLVHKLHALRIEEPAGWRWPLEDGRSATADYMLGYSGIYSFLLRVFWPGLRRPFFSELHLPAKEH